MNYFGKKIRSTITDKDELEIQLLKQAILAAIKNGYSVEYRERYLLYKYSEDFVVNKTQDLSANVTFKGFQAGAAVDHYIALFISEDNCDIGVVTFRAPDGVGVWWKNLRKNCCLADICDIVRFSHKFALLVHEDTEDSYDSSEASHHASE